MNKLNILFFEIFFLKFFEEYTSRYLHLFFIFFKIFCSTSDDFPSIFDKLVKSLSLLRSFFISSPDDKSDFFSKLLLGVGSSLNSGGNTKGSFVLTKNSSAFDCFFKVSPSLTL